MLVKVEFDREEDGRWIAEAVDFPGVIVYGETQEEAMKKVKELALSLIADRLEHGEYVPGLDPISFTEDYRGTVAVS